MTPAPQATINVLQQERMSPVVSVRSGSCDGWTGVGYDPAGHVALEANSVSTFVPGRAGAEGEE